MAQTWGYSRDNGPHTWAVHFPDAAGHAQSPVDISTNDVIYDSDLCLKPLTTSYKEEDSFQVINTGESFKVNIDQPSEIHGGPLSDRYKLEQFHLHWGSCDDQGSEHTIDGQTYPGEIHFVHWNCSKYTSFSEAVDKADGLAVIGVMIQVGEEHSGFKDLVDTMRNVKTGGQACQILRSFNPTVLLPENTTDYWTYHGSLTTPPCYESVQWIVLKDPVRYSQKQLLALRNLLNADCKCIMDNYRPPLPLGTRKVRSSFPNSCRL